MIHDKARNALCSNTSERKEVCNHTEYIFIHDCIHNEFTGDQNMYWSRTGFPTFAIHEYKANWEEPITAEACPFRPLPALSGRWIQCNRKQSPWDLPFGLFEYMCIYSFFKRLELHLYGARIQDSCQTFLSAVCPWSCPNFKQVHVYMLEECGRAERLLVIVILSSIVDRKPGRFRYLVLQRGEPSRREEMKNSFLKLKTKTLFIPFIM